MTHQTFHPLYLFLCKHPNISSEHPALVFKRTQTVLKSLGFEMENCLVFYKDLKKFLNYFKFKIKLDLWQFTDHLNGILVKIMDQKCDFQKLLLVVSKNKFSTASKCR